MARVSFGMQPVFLSGFRIGVDIFMKMTDTDLDLLARYTRQHAEDAFAEIVRRHLDLVFSAALRQVRSPQLAEEVAQSVFTDLARQAHRLAPGTVLTAWLYQVARRTAIDVVRREARRQIREQTACELTAMNAPALLGQSPMEPEADWTHIEPLLDEAMGALGEPDRAAVLLRYFENKSLREVGQTLGTNEDAARKRVDRAVERLRQFLAKRGVAAGASGLVVIISANAVQATPAALAASISAAALVGTAGSVSIALTATKIIAMTTLQKTLVTAVLAALAGAVFYEARQAAQLRAENQSLQQQAPLTNELVRLRAENQKLTDAATRKEDQKALTQAQLNELLKLRGQAGQARSAVQELARAKASPAPLNALMQAISTNAFAQGVAQAEKSGKRDALAKVARMKEALHLTDEQAQALTELMLKHVEENSQRALQMMSGAQTPGETQATLPASNNEEAEIKSLLNPEQLAAYADFQQAEASTAAANSVKAEVAAMAARLELTPEQKDQLQAAIAQYNLSHAPSSEEMAAMAQAKTSGNLADAILLQVDYNKRELENKLSLFEGILTPAQLQTYKQAQLDMIEMPMKILPRRVGP
jgi:RNA polymerase sigma factor (sigma-70 family)